jgi:hypothetical protein
MYFSHKFNQHNINRQAVQQQLRLPQPLLLQQQQQQQRLPLLLQLQAIAVALANVLTVLFNLKFKVLL